MNHVITQSVANIFSRPVDNNYNSMEALLDDAKNEMNQSRTLKVTGSDISFNSDVDGFNLIVDGQDPLPLTNYSLTQVAKMAKIPTAVLERLHKKNRDDLVVDNLDVLFPNSRSQTKFILVRDHYDNVGGIDSVARAINGGDYARLWDFEVFGEIEDFLLTEGFTPTLPLITVNGWRNGLMHGLHAGLFRGDECSFGFFFAKKELKDSSTDLGGLQPGIMVWNSEVGASL